ncbi:MAG: PKD domain-containing protein [Thermoplasmatota archaeon]
MHDLKQSLGANAFTAAPPIARATVDTPYGAVGQLLAFHGNASKDPQESPLLYTWAFGDGMTGAGPEVTHAFATTGTFVAVLTVENAYQLTDTESVRVYITSIPHAPVANLTASPMAGWVGQSIALNASGSFDPDGKPIRVVWNFGDGLGSTDLAPVHTYSAPGRHLVCLTIIDAKGLQTSSNVVIPISEKMNASNTIDATQTAQNLTIFVPSGDADIKAVLTFDGTPTNDLALELRDASGAVLSTASSTGPSAAVPPVPTGGATMPTQTATLAYHVAHGPFGNWTLSIVRHGGVRISYTVAEETLYG